MRRGAFSRRVGEGGQLGWLLGVAIVVGLLGFADVVSAGDLGSAGNPGRAVESGGAPGVAGDGREPASTGNLAGASGGASNVAGGGRRSGGWAGLWATREQQAQRLLESQRPAEAASLFGDPRRRAYAELQAGQYDKAAEQLAPFKDVDSQYNRGNALAHAGKLQDALKAYDAALARSPGNSDVTRNRELVARALEEQKRGNQSSNGGKPQGNGQGGQGQSNGGQGSDGANAANGQKQGGANSDGQSRDGGQQQAGKQGEAGSQPPAANPSQPGAPGQSGNQQQAGAQAQQGDPAQSARQAQAGNPSQQGNSAQSQSGNGAQPYTGSTGSGNQAQDDLSEAARLAQRAKAADSAAAAQGQSQAQAFADAGQRGTANSPDKGITVNKALAGADGTPQQPRSEQALALDQWLRGIPEDSGELLRRKFMIEHMMKQQGYEP
jgi:Ca-activated chloride channel family protein